MGNILNTRIVLRHDYSANWDAVKDTAILLEGEAGLEYCLDGSVKVKFGDGVNTWGALPYWGGAHDGVEEAIRAIEARLDTIDTQIVALQNTIGHVEEGKTVVDLITEAQATATTNAINAILGEGVQEDFDTLKEIAEYIEQDKEGVVAITEHLARLDKEAKKLAAITAYNKYEVCYTPIGTLVDYNDKEIRIMCPADTEWTRQSGAGNPDLYYIGFKAYAPEGVVSFKEDTNLIIQDNTMYYFENNNYAGVDEYGRKYSIIWLPVAYYDNNEWYYYGEKSTADKYIGFHYSVEWYDAAGVRVGSDVIKINLSNENCHNVIEPYYIANVVKNHLSDIPTATMEALGLVKASQEIAVEEDGKLRVNEISTDKLVQGLEELILNGGSANI